MSTPAKMFNDEMQDTIPESAPRILLVEDNRDQAFVLSYYLNSEGYYVDWCDSPQSAIKSAYQHNYQLILLDVMLNSEKDGFTLCQQFKADPALKQIPIIMVTARTAKKDRVNGLRLGADDYITKPFSREEVLARINAVMRRKASYDFDQKYQELLENTDDIVLFLTPKGQIEHANRQAALLIPELNQSNKSVHFLDLFDEIYVNSISSVIDRVLEGHEVTGNSWRLKQSRLNLLSVDARLVPLHQGSRIIGIGAVLRDSSAREHVVQALEKNTQELRKRVEHASEQLNEVQQKLVMSEKMAVMGQLAAGIAHELRNPLNTINVAVHYLQKVLKSDDHPNVADHFKIIKQEIQRAQKIIDNLLDFSKKSSAEKALVDVNAVLEQTLAIVKKELEINDIVVKKVLASIEPCWANPDELKQVFLNLILNAKDAMPEGGTLTVSTSMKNGQINIKFRDTGIGIPPEHLNKIFDPFFTTSQNDKNIGIGLSIVHSAVERNNGSIKVESIKGRGTTFSILLPAFSSARENDLASVN